MACAELAAQQQTKRRDGGCDWWIRRIRDRASNLSCVSAASRAPQRTRSASRLLSTANAVPFSCKVEWRARAVGASRRCDLEYDELTSCAQAVAPLRIGFATRLRRDAQCLGASLRSAGAAGVLRRDALPSPAAPSRGGGNLVHGGHHSVAPICRRGADGGLCLARHAGHRAGLANGLAGRLDMG